MENEYLLSMEQISKQFPGVRALSNVELRARKGTVHALMGENGAGKSTLMKCLIGIYAPDSGTIEFNGQTVSIVNTHHALSMGQVTLSELNLRTRDLLGRLGIVVAPEKKMVELSIANTQLIEIAKAI